MLSLQVCSRTGQRSRVQTLGASVRQPLEVRPVFAEPAKRSTDKLKMARFFHPQTTAHLTFYGPAMCAEPPHRRGTGMFSAADRDIGLADSAGRGCTYFYTHDPGIAWEWTLP